LHALCSSLPADPVGPETARRLVTGWLKGDARPLQATVGPRPARVRTFSDQAGRALYHVVHTEPAGFVVVAADDRIEPIIAFSDDSSFDPSPENPLGALLFGDISARISGVRTGRIERGGLRNPVQRRPANKWDRLLELAESAQGRLGVTSLLPGPSDIRVAPLLQSKWGQNSVCQSPCFNYYTPSNYRTGCVATTMAQVMRYYEYPTEPVGIRAFWVRVDRADWYGATTRGGDGAGGPYQWGQMTLVPDCWIGLEQRQAIGALCHDAAISVNTEFGSSSSRADTLKAGSALVETFMFATATTAYNAGADIGASLQAMINPNLDARSPVIIGIRGDSGHAVVCDGYGYSYSTLYHHLNMGWNGLYDAWYNLPDIDSNPSYSSVYKCIYNIRPAALADGEAVSGRVCDPKGRPIPELTVLARPLGRGPAVYAQTDEKGIYAFDDLASNTTYVIEIANQDYLFGAKTVTTGESRDDSTACGNLWAQDFYGQYKPGCLIGHWKLDEAAGAIAEDSAGFSHGILVGDPVWQPFAGRIDGALAFDGNDYVEIPNEWNFDLVEAISVAAWVNIDLVDEPWQVVVAKGDSAWRISTYRSSRRLHFAVTGAPDYVQINSATRVPLHEWHHVCGTYDGTALRLYIDGVEEPGSPVPYTGKITTNNYPVSIGENLQKRGRGWNGTLDDVRIYNYALSSGEVSRFLCELNSQADLNYDCAVDMADYARLSSAWLSDVNSPDWNGEFDISCPADGRVDMTDLNVFIQSWLLRGR